MNKNKEFLLYSSDSRFPELDCTTCSTLLLLLLSRFCTTCIVVHFFQKSFQNYIVLHVYKGAEHS